MNQEMFKDVIIFSMAEPGAMGAGGHMEFVTDKGEIFNLWYLSEDTPWNDVKNCFPVLKDCFFNGPMKERPEGAPKEIVFYLDDSNINISTKVAPGWQHIYMGFGNHLIVRDDYFEGFSNAISDLTEEADIYGEWRERAIKYIKEK